MKMDGGDFVFREYWIFRLSVFSQDCQGSWQNIVLQATELGIASCIISRGEETFDSEEGRALMKEWGVPDNYICQGFVILGYIDGEQPVSKPRKPGRVRIIE